MMIVACGKIQQRGQKHAGLPETVIVALQAGEDQVHFFLGDCRGKDFRGAERIKLGEVIIGDVDAAVGAFRKGFLDGLLHTLRAERKRDHFAAVLFLQAQRFFQRVGIRFVHFEADVRFLDPVSGDGQRGVFGGNLFDADEDVHAEPFTANSARFRARGRVEVEILRFAQDDEQ